MKSRWLIRSAVVAVAATVACRSSEVKPEPSAASSTSAATAAAPVSSAQTPLTRIVFVDQEKCCQCTRDRIEGSWAALQAALAGRGNSIPVARVHVDTQPQLAAEYRAKRPFLALPAVYLLDGSGNVLELLQGELSQAELSAAMDQP
jgi:hypothetical protein